MTPFIGAICVFTLSTVLISFTVVFAYINTTHLIFPSPIYCHFIERPYININRRYKTDSVSHPPFCEYPLLPRVDLPSATVYFLALLRWGREILDTQREQRCFKRSNASYLIGLLLLALRCRPHHGDSGDLVDCLHHPRGVSAVLHVAPRTNTLHN
jgi:hypothetical protein